MIRPFTFPSSLLSLLIILLLPSFSSAQTGTASVNISSDASSFVYLSTWRSDMAGGVYEAYSNASDASVTYSFYGVKVAYVATSKSDRGLFLLTLDNAQAYTVDLFDNSGYPQSPSIHWTSPLLPYGLHNVTLKQIGIDARFGYYPYLYTSTWEKTVPINVASYTATELLTTATTGAIGSKPTGGSDPDMGNGSTTTNHHIAPIIGGVIGGLLAIALSVFLVYLWRKDRRSAQRGGGNLVKMPKKAEGKMTIEDDGPNYPDTPPADTPYGYVNSSPQPYGYISPGSTAPSPHPPSTNYGYQDYPQSQSHQFRPPSQSQHYQQPYPPQPTERWASPTLSSQQQPYQPSSTPPYQPLSTSTHGNSQSLDSYPQYGDYSNPDAHSRVSRAYPYHVQGVGDAQKSYPVPEI